MGQDRIKTGAATVHVAQFILMSIKLRMSHLRRVFWTTEGVEGLADCETSRFRSSG